MCWELFYEAFAWCADMYNFLHLRDVVVILVCVWCLYFSQEKYYNVVRLTVETRDTPGRLMKKAVSHLSIGDTDIVPAIEGIDHLKPIVADIHIWNMHEFRRKARYSSDITKKADAGTLRLDEVLERYGDSNTDIEVHISGDDGKEGRMYFTEH